MEDTIVAVSTAMGKGAISIIRLSGNDSISIVNSIFNGKDLTKVLTHTINYGHIVYNNEIIDEVLVSIMKNPNSYTKEDVVEINTHASIAVVKKILEILILQGCRLAEPGEFTKRAFLNGRIGLTEAEGVMNLINSETEISRKMAINELSGKVSKKVNIIRDKLMDLISNVEVNIDYPEYDDIEIMTVKKIDESLKKIKSSLNEIIKNSESGKIINDGIKTVILGKPNVGKSSLLNCLLEEEKAIVTNIQGTTRDIVEGSFYIDGIKLNLIDTAGIRKSQDMIEKIGIEKSLKLINDAELILLMLDGSCELSDEDKLLLEKTKDKKRIIIINKTDIKTVFDDIKGIKVSVKNNEGIEHIKDRIREMFNFGDFINKDITAFTNTRQISLLKQAYKSICDAQVSINSNNEIDIIEIDLKAAWNYLGELIGSKYSDELLDNLFSRFCLGK